MARSYRPVVRDQPFLMAPDMREWLPSDHLVWFLLETLRELDLSVFHRRHMLVGAGRAAYDPDMLVALLIYAYCRGVRSSRQIERLCLTDVAFRVICAQDAPDHTKIARFRAEHQEAFASLFTQVLSVAALAGLGRFGTVAIDGTKVKANASLQANRSRAWIAEQVQVILAEAEGVDAAEDAEHGRQEPGDHGDRMPPGMGDRGSRAARIAAAAAEVRAQEQAEAQESEADVQARAAEALARIERVKDGKQTGRPPRGADRVTEARLRLERAIARQQAKIDRRAARVAAGERVSGVVPVPVEQHISVRRARSAFQAAAAHVDQPPALKKDPETKVNLSDPASRVMPTRNGWVQGYNAQFAVTADQLIVALSLGQNTADVHAFGPMMDAAVAAADAVHALTGNPQHRIGTVLADAGYPSLANLTAPGPDRLIALSKTHQVAKNARDNPAQGQPPQDAGPYEAMDHRLRTPEGAALYKRRGATVEPGIGNLKKLLDRFSRRGLQAATSELQLAATAFNLLKIHRAATT